MNAIQKNRVTITGQGKTPMIFAHGFACDQKIWDQVAPAFEKDFRVVRFDHVGTRTEDTSYFTAGKYTNYQDYATDLIQVVKDADLRGAILVAHSASSMIGTLAEIQEPGLFSKIIMMGPSPCYLNAGDYPGGLDRAMVDGILTAMASNYKEWAGNMAPMFMGNADRPELGAELVKVFQTRDPNLIPKFGKAVFHSDHRADLAKLKTPSLIVQCVDDAVSPLAVGEYMLKNMSNAKRVVLKANGHYPQISAPQELIQAIRSFV